MSSKIFDIVRFNDLDEYLSSINESNINLLNTDRQNLLQEAIANDADKIALDLIEKGIELNTQDNNGQTALHYVALYKNSVLAVSILDNGGNIDVLDKYGNSPLWTATFNARGNYEIVKIFLTYGAKPLAKNNSGRSPLDFARQIGDKTLIDLLTKN